MRELAIYNLVAVHADYSFELDVILVMHGGRRWGSRLAPGASPAALLRL